MRKIAYAITAGAFAASALVAGQAFAINGNSAAAKNTEENSAYQAPAGKNAPGMTTGMATSAQSWDSAKVTVKRVSELPKAERASVKSEAKHDPAKLRELHASIRKHKGVVSELRAQNVTVNDVIARRKAADGSMLYITM